MARRSTPYFERTPGAPAPVAVDVTRRVAFSEVDPLGIVWYGRYAVYFEEGAAELGRRCGLSYKDFFDAQLRAPIVQFHVDYTRMLRLDEVFTLRAAWVWTDAARLNTEYTLIKQDGALAASGYTVQMFLDAQTGDACMASPALLLRCREQWKAGAFACLQ